MPRRPILPLAALLFTLPLSGQAGRPTVDLDAATTAMRNGIDAANRNDLAAAKRYFTHATVLAPTIPAPHAALGSILLAQGDFGNAERELRKAHTLDPKDPAVTLNLARTDVSLRHFDDAAALFHQALAADPPPVLTDEETLTYAIALSASGDLNGAKTLLAQALTRAPNSALLQDALGSLLAQTGSMDEAIPHFERAVSLDPSLNQAQVHLGTLLIAQNRPADAIGPLESAVAADPSSFDANLQLGRALSAVHRDVDALPVLHHALDLRAQAGASTASLYDLALALQASGDSRAAVALFAAVTAPQSRLPMASLGSALTNYALARVQTGDAAGALPLYARALALGPDSAVFREDYGVAFLQQADLTHAIEQFRAGLTLDPNSAHLHYDLGLALKLKDDLSAAIPEFERAAQLDPTLPDPPYTLGVIYMQQGRYADALTQLQRATQLQPDNGEAWALLGGVQKDSGDATGAAESLRRAIALEPDQPSLHIQLASLFSQDGKTGDAAAERKIAAELSRAAVSHQRATFALKSGRTLLEQGKLPEAAAQLTTAAEADPKDPEPHRLLAEVLRRQNKPAEAALERKQAASLESASPPPDAPTPAAAQP